MRLHTHIQYFCPWYEHTAIVRRTETVRRTEVVRYISRVNHYVMPVALRALATVAADKDAVAVDEDASADEWVESEGDEEYER